jgi:hypothetical protein
VDLSQQAGKAPLKAGDKGVLLRFRLPCRQIRQQGLDPLDIGQNFNIVLGDNLF